MSSETKKVVIYARVSSEKQDVDLSISGQVKALREYATHNGYSVVKEYIDEAESGRSIDRPGFKQMIIAARQKPLQFEMILVWKLSRFARNREDSIIYKSLLRKQGIQVISINEPLEDTPSGRLLEGIIEVLDEFYSANLAQDVTRGMRETANRGFYPGGPPPYGYARIKVQDGAVQRVKLEPDPATAPIVERMFKECLSGKGMIEITRGLNGDGLTTRKNKKWSKTSVNVVLKNEVYTGTLIWGEFTKNHNGGTHQPVIRVDNAWPSIVDQDTFERVQAKLTSRAPKITHPRVIHSEYILSGILRCKNCNAAMVGHAVKSGQFFYYMCGNARKRGRGLCTTHLLPKERIETFVVDRLKRYILTEENLQDLVRLTNEDMAEKCKGENGRLEIIQAEMLDVEGRLAKLYDALETGEFKGGQLAPRIKALFDKKEELERAKTEAEEALKYHTIELASPVVVRDYVQSMRTLLEESSIMRRKAFLRSFLDRIEVDESNAKFIYTWPPDDPPTETVGVLPIVHDGPPSCTISGTTGVSFSNREVNMASEGHDSLSVIEAYKVQFERVKHLDKMALITFTVVAILEMALYAAHVWEDVSIHQSSEVFGIGLLALALAAGGAHAVIANADDYWITFVVIAQLTKGLGLVQRGIFPVSLLAQVPAGQLSFIRRLLGGFRGPFLIVYVILGWYGAFLMLGEWLSLPLAFFLAILMPVSLAVASALFSYGRLKHQMVALRRHDELVEASRNNVVDSHCDLAEALLQLDPPRLFHAQKQYELALEIEPGHPRAKEGLQRVLDWKGVGSIPSRSSQGVGQSI